MRRFGKILLYALAILVILLVAAISLTIGWRPFFGPRARPLTSRKFESTPARLEHGKYLAETRGCFGCHSPHNWMVHGAPILEGRQGSGMDMPIAALPGRVVAPNITSDPETGAGTWTDDQFARAIREGIGHDGRALFPMMPYELYRHMSDEDVAAVVVFLRSLPAVHNPLPPTELIFPVKYLIRSVPEPLTEVVPEPDRRDTVKWGQYLVTTSACEGCHSPFVGHERPASMALAGGFPLAGPWGNVASANITPDPSGIGYYDDSLFIQAMHTGYVKARELNQIMPYGEFKEIPEDELMAMFAYLKTVNPLKHRVDNSLPPTDCKVCRGKHGGGNLN